MNEFEKSVNPIPKYTTSLLLLTLPRPCFQFGLFFCLAAGLQKQQSKYCFWKGTLFISFHTYYIYFTLFWYGSKTSQNNTLKAILNKYFVDLFLVSSGLALHSLDTLTDCWIIRFMGGEDLPIICQLAFCHSAPFTSSQSGQSVLIYEAFFSIVKHYDCLRVSFINEERIKHHVRWLAKYYLVRATWPYDCLCLCMYSLTSHFIMMDSPIQQQSRHHLYCIVTLNASLDCDNSTPLRFCVY